MADEQRDLPVSSTLVRSGRATVATVFNADAAPADRRTALMKTVAVGSVGLAGTTAAAELIANNPQLLHAISSADVSAGWITAASTAGFGGAFLGLWRLMDGGPMSQSDRGVFTKFFHATRTVGYVGAAVVGVTAAAFAGAGVEHLAPDGVAIATAMAGVASGAAGLGVGGHALQRIVGGRQVRTRSSRPAQLGE